MVRFVKYRAKQGGNLHEVANQTVRGRFRAITLTSIAIIASMLPLLSETSKQVQILIPLVTSIVFGLLSYPLLIFLVLSALYAIMKDISYVRIPLEGINPI